jgi:hypothetical protein
MGGFAINKNVEVDTLGGVLSNIILEDYAPEY